jgi:PAS domain S-box-containing protein
MANSLAQPRWAEHCNRSVTNVTNRRAIRHPTLNIANSAIYSGYLPPAGADDCRRGNTEELPQAVCIKSFFSRGLRSVTGETPDKAWPPDSTSLFEKLFESSPDAVLVTDHAGLILRANGQTESLFGYARHELIGELVELLIPERFHSVHPKHRSAYSSQPRVRAMGAGLELFGRRKDGTEIPVDIMLSPLQIAGDQLVLAVVRDVSQKRLAEQALRRSEQQFRSLFEFSPDAIVVTSREGKITEANAQVEKFFGYSRSELLGQTVEILIPERFRSTHPKHRADYAVHSRVRTMGAGLELYGLRKDGSEFPVDIMLGPVEGPEGQVVLSVIRDLSEKKEIEQALRRSEQENRYLEEELSTTHQFEEIVGESPGLKRVLKQVEDVAETDATVLILGETGTGKELIARAIHRLSPRRDKGFVRLNCSAIPSGLLESELFGHEKGAFTGAIAQKIGRLELAHQGTFFLDEVGDLPAELQPKILRALQEKEFERVGGNRTIPVNVRLVAATNRDLAKMVNAGQFRSDLYYRLRVFPVTIPPLRERREDIPLLVRYFLASHSKRMGRHIETIPSETMDALTRWHWPGNVRELENFIERSVILTPGSVLRAPLAELEAIEESSGLADTNLKTAEREHILRILRECKGMIGGSGGAAERLGLKRTTLNSKIKKLRIQRRDYI